MKEFELTEAGWYWFEPEFPDVNQAKFLFFSEAPEVKELNCKMYRGQYYGPIDIEALKSQLSHTGMFKVKEWNWEYYQ